MTVAAPRGDRAVPAAGGDAVPVLRLDASPVTAPDPILLMAAAVVAGEEAALWMRPADGSAIVGTGRAWAIEPDGPGRFAAVREAWSAIAERLAATGMSGSAGPLLLGGFGFVGDRPEIGRAHV